MILEAFKKPKISPCCENLQFQISSILKPFWRVPITFWWKSQIFGFPAVENFPDVQWFSSLHRSKALIIRNNFHCHNTDVDGLFWVKDHKKCLLGGFKNTFFERHFDVEISAIFKVFNVWENSRFHNFTKEYWKYHS